jgi:hypothetical protein
MREKEMAIEIAERIAALKDETCSLNLMLADWRVHKDGVEVNWREKLRQFKTSNTVFLDCAAANSQKLRDTLFAIQHSPDSIDPLLGLFDL